jgi:hypothetical protein
MPASAAALPLHQQLILKDRDPELYAILSGAPLAPALEAQLLSGTLAMVAPVGPTPEEMRAQQVALLTQTNPYVPESRNLSAQLRLEALDPAAAAVQRANAQPYIALEAANAETARRQQEAALAEGRARFSQAAAVGAARQHIASGLF